MVVAVDRFRVLLLVLYGLQHTSGNCYDSPLGMQNKQISGNQITDSSGAQIGDKARLAYTEGASWCILGASIGRYLEIDLGTPHIVCGLATQGNSVADQWVLSFKLTFSPDGSVYKDYKENGETREFVGNLDRDSIVQSTIYAKPIARVIRIVPLNHVGVACMRLEIYGVMIQSGNVALRKTAYQPSTDHSGVATRAVDGDPNPDYPANTCTHTKGMTDPWWRVDLGSSQPIAEVVITNRDGTYGTQRLWDKTFELRIGDNENIMNNVKCGDKYGILAGQKISILCNPRMNGRYVGIRLIGWDALTLCEVEVYTRENVAKNKTASQSSSFSGGYAYRAVDGDLTPLYGSGQMCSHTNNGDAKPWWMVDLGTSTHVTEVYIVNKEDNKDNRLRSFELRIGEDGTRGGVSNPKCGDVYAIPDARVRSIYCIPAMPGRYLTIKSNVPLLTLCEVEVYTTKQACSFSAVGVSDKTVIPDARLTASSKWDDDYAPSKARLHFTGVWVPRDNSPWLKVDLGALHEVCAVATQGDPDPNDKEWTKRYKIEISTDGAVWSYINKAQIFSGNRDGISIVKHNFPDPQLARFVQFLPIEKHRYYAMRMEVYGRPKECFTALGLESGSIPSSRVTASSKINNSHAANNGRLYGASSWCSVTSGPSEFLQVDLGSVYTVTGVATQGDVGNKYWVKNYRVVYSYDGLRWLGYRDQEMPSDKVFTGNEDEKSVRANYFKVPLAARFVRLMPTARKGANCVRMELYGCSTYIIPVIEPISDQTLPTSRDGHTDITCSARGYGSLIGFEWYSSGKEMTQLSQGISRLPTRATSVLRVNYTSADHVLKSFTCRAPSGRDVPCSRNITCYASYPGLPGGGMVASHVTVGTTLRLPSNPRDVRATDVGPRSATLSWSAVIPGDGEGPVISHVINFVNTSGPITIDSPLPQTRLRLTYLAPYTHYKAKVRASSKVGNGEWSAELDFRTSQAAPSEPLGLSYSLGKPQGFLPPIMTLSWQPPSQSNGIITGYLIIYNYSSTFDPACKGHVTFRGPGQVEKHSLLMRGAFTYVISVQAITVAIGPPSVIVTITTPEYVPSSAPANITVLHTADGSNHTIIWNAIPPEQSNGHVTVYEITSTRVLTNQSQALDYSDLSSKSFNTSMTSVTLRGLPACSFYDVIVRGFTKVGPGPYSDIMRLETSEPDAPKGLVVAGSTKREVDLEWTAPDTKGASIECYKISLRGSKPYDSSFSDNAIRVLSAGSVTSHRVPNLVPGTRYDLRIQAVTECGDGEYSATVLAETLIDNPLAPVVPYMQLLNGTNTGHVNVTLWPVKPTNGPISFYHVLVEDVTDQRVRKRREIAKEYSVAAELSADAVDPGAVFTIGDGKIYGIYKNIPLQRGKKYKVYERAVTVTPEVTLTGKEAVIASISMPKEIAVPQMKAQTSGAQMAAYVVLPLLIIAIVAALVVIWKRRRRRRRRPPPSKTDSVLLDQDDDISAVTTGAIELGITSYIYDKDEPKSGDVPDASPDLADIYSEAISEDTHGPIPVLQFVDYFNRAKQNNNARLEAEFKKLFKLSKHHPSEAAKKRVNKAKNRYANIVTYDHSRVVLEKLSNDPHSDYINASYLRDYDGSPKAYIATQGCVEPSSGDFWRMMWQERRCVIVMLTGLIEGHKKKCHQYWPDSTSKYCNLRVTLRKTEVFADYIIRTFVMSQVGQTEERYVYQYHFTVWPDKGVPQYATAVLGLRRKITKDSLPGARPWVIHCSAGVGRTGAFLVIDAMLRQAKKQKTVDIFNYVKAIREDRPHMVQTSEQYVFIHLAVLEALVCGSTDIPADNMKAAMARLSKLRTPGNVSGYEAEFQRLSVIVPSSVPDVDVSSGSKYRISLIDKKSTLKSPAKRKLTAYMNASFANAYREKNAFILCPAPSSEDITNFWQMVLDFSVGTVVMLYDTSEGQKRYRQYWPSRDAKSYGKIQVQLLDEDVESQIITRRFVLTTKEGASREVRHFQVIGWTEQKLPDKSSVLRLIESTQSSQQQSGNAAILVQCSNGAGRSGTLCAVLSVIDRVKAEHVVDVFQAVKVLRASRPGAVESLRQYVFCYEATMAFLDSFSDYANFS
ncbi:receptor-type tyrosine-protein phosphatase S-like isoform X3 [Nematostella vectensis]|uniref:receptor-type tyrosine-protein phosphatase S-like isoform X3 n=1 Tax=Nematostella vectensis TaxID=45351 RepID=UPI00207709B6|nr:receptor-type tyrosine-protein phosphatase S-like isoform X3 [Nematostella vectensis]